MKCTRRNFLAGLGATAVVGIPSGVFSQGSTSPNILLITADDMNFDSLGVTGCTVPDITPNLDALAEEGIRFTQAHVTSAICQPSRSALMTGRFPHRSGALGFDPIKLDVPTLQESLRAAGYMNGIMAKNEHLAPREKFCWDVYITAAELGGGKDPKAYYTHCKAFFKQAKSSGKPFFLMANSTDPHRPFPGAEVANQAKADNANANISRTYKPEEVTVPPFLPDLPKVREEMAQYYTAVHRCDETVGQILKALREEDLEENTVVFFLSDNGISQPFAKTNCYFTSTATPLIVRWPGKFRPCVNRNALVSGVDFMPTVLDILNAKPVKGLNGYSYLSLLTGSTKNTHTTAFTFITSTSAGLHFPMRCIRTKRYSYVFNAWSDGKTTFRNEPMGGMAFKAMQASSDPNVAKRVKFFLYRTPEEFYDLRTDPWEQKNLITEASYAKQIDTLRSQLLEMMDSTNDPLLERFRARVTALKSG